MIGLYIGLGVLLAIFSVAAIVLIRTVRFVPEDFDRAEPLPEKINEKKVISDLSSMIKCKTVSHSDPSLDNDAEFKKFKALLKRLFPLVYQRCELEEVNERAMLFRWRGESVENPTVLMAHYDVVSVVEELWDKPAFDGVVENGIMYGRGVVDTKCSLNAILQAAEKLIAEGFVPKSDIYFAFGGNEEVNGDAAPAIVKLFKERGITPSMVLDEGGAVVNGVFPGVKSPTAVIGIAEKGMLNLEYIVNGGGGHSSAPLPGTPIDRLSAACVKLKKTPFKFTLTEPTKQMFDTLGRRSTFVYRMIFANLWLFSPVLNLITKKSGGQLNAIARTTVAFTQMEGSKGINVIPPYARMASNSRIIPGETMESALETIKKCVNDDKIEIKVINGMNPSVISRTDCEGYERVKDAVSQTWCDAVASPFLMTACSDSRHWGEISDRVYRFSPLTLTPEEQATIHGNNEHATVEAIIRAVEFYVRLIKMS